MTFVNKVQQFPSKGLSRESLFWLYTICKSVWSDKMQILCSICHSHTHITRTIKYWSEMRPLECISSLEIVPPKHRTIATEAFPACETYSVHQRRILAKFWCAAHSARCECAHIWFNTFRCLLWTCIHMEEIHLWRSTSDRTPNTRVVLDALAECQRKLWWRRGALKQ